MRAADFRLDMVYPADDPQCAVLTLGEKSVRLATPGAPPLPQALPVFEPQFVVTRAGAAPGEGRAGMLYRDLIPGRLGGRYIASHITIPKGGPVADWVHYHRIALQLIVVRKGWVRVVYEDQCDPFVMQAGDLVLQPPGIRHRVLESSDGLEVIELGAPALHATFADHELGLPNGSNPSRTFGGQQFLRHVASESPWRTYRSAEVQETGLSEATAGVADARIVRPGGATEVSFEAHQGELVFGVLLEGCATLQFTGEHELGVADAFVIPPQQAWRLSGMSADCLLLLVNTARLG